MTNEKVELLRIRNIEKQLAVINRNRLILNENLISTGEYHRSSSSMENRTRVRRRSSLDQQIIERWKSLGEQCEPHRQLPWSIQKLIIRRHFRRHYKELVREFDPLNSRVTLDYHIIELEN